jgi:hypothetical protein
MLRPVCLSIGGIAVLAAMFSAPNLTVSPEIAPAETGKVVLPAAAGEKSRPMGEDLALGYINGVVTVNGEPVAVKGSVAVRGDSVGPAAGVGITMVRSQAMRDVPDLVPLPAETWVWVIPDSMIDEMVVLSGLGDWAEFEVDFATGSYLHYDISVVSDDMPVYMIRLSGELTGEAALPELPWHRTLHFDWQADGTLAGYGLSSGVSATETYQVPAVIAGRYGAANSRTRVPAKVTSTLTITSFDFDVGDWKGSGTRAVSIPSGDQETAVSNGK